MAEPPGPDRTSRKRPGKRKASGEIDRTKPLVGTVTSFDENTGRGFIEGEGLRAGAIIESRHLEEHGLRSLPEGAVVEFLVEQPDPEDRSYFDVAKVLGIDLAPAETYHRDKPAPQAMFQPGPEAESKPPGLDLPSLLRKQQAPETASTPILPGTGRGTSRSRRRRLVEGAPAPPAELTTAESPPDEAPSPDLQSVAELRERHLDLLRSWTPAGADKTAVAGLAQRAESLRQAAAALGAWLDDAEERDRAQGIVDYWTAALGALPDTAFPEMLRLAEFDPALPAAAVERAEAIFADHQGTAREADAEAMLLCLVRPGPGGGILVRPPVARADLEHADGVTDMTASQGDLVDALVAAGIIRKLPGEGPAEDRFDFLHGSVARAWPRLKTLLERRRSDVAVRDKLRATAQLWKDSNHDSGYLLTGTVLDDAGRYLGEDKALDEFLLASRHSENRWRRLRLAGWIVGPVAAVALFMIGAGGGYSFGNAIGWESGASAGYEQGATSGFEAGATRESEAPTAEADFEAEAAAAARAAAKNAQPDPLPALGVDGPGPTGWIWAGADDLRLVRWLRGNRDAAPAAPAGIRAGMPYRLRANIVLRGGPPDEEYVFAPQTGLAPAAGLIVVTGAPRRYDRPSGPQYWLPVRIVPQAFLQHSRADPARVDGLAARLRRAGYEISINAAAEGNEGRREIQYYRKSDEAEAAALASLVAAALQRAGGAPVPIACRLLGNAGTGSAVMDLWLDFEGVEVRAEGQRTAAPEVTCVE